MADIYKQAVKQKLRFPSGRGLLTVEQLMDLPMTSTTGKLNLRDIATPIAEKLASKGLSVLSFFDKPTEDPTAKLQMAIISDIVASKQAENVAKSTAKAKETERAQLQELLAKKRAEVLGNLTAEEIEAKLAAL